MSWNLPAVRASSVLPAHLDRLAGQFRDLSLEVRASVAGLAGDAAGRAVRDLLLCFWRQRPAVRPPGPDRYDWSRDDWEDRQEREEQWREPPDDPPETVEVAPPSSESPLPALLCVAAWLLKRGSLLGLVGTGLGLGGLALLRRHRRPSHSEVIRGVADLASLLALLDSAAKGLRGR